MGKVERWLGGRLKAIRAFIDDWYGHDLHAKRVDSLAGATLGVMTSASLAVAVIGQLGAAGESLGMIVEVQYVEDPNAFVVPARMHALRTHSNQARAQTIPAHGPLR